MWPLFLVAGLEFFSSSPDADWTVVGTTGGWVWRYIVRGIGIFTWDISASMTRLHVVSISGVIELVHALIRSSTALFVESWVAQVQWPFVNEEDYSAVSEMSLISSELHQCSSLGRLNLNRFHVNKQSHTKDDAEGRQQLSNSNVCHLENSPPLIS